MLNRLKTVASHGILASRAAKGLTTELAVEASRSAAHAPIDVTKAISDVPLRAIGLGSARRRDPGPNLAVPPPRLKRFSSGWEPLARAQYHQIPDAGRRIQARFYENLKTTLEGMQTERGRALVVVPARNEEQCITDTLDHLLAARAGDEKIELAVVVNASTDRTDPIVREWAEAHRGEVKLHVIDQPQPGKTSALLSVEQLFEGRGAHPEWIVQVDADTRIHAGDIRKLIGRARDRGQIAATGSVHKVRRDGGPLLIPTEGPPGTFRTQVLSGQFFVCRTRPWLAGYRTIQETYPQSATEDTLLTAMFRVAGFKTGSRTDAEDIPYETLGASSMGEATAQMTRWLTGSVQLADLYGIELLEQIGLRPDPKHELENAIRSGAKASLGATMRALDVRCLPSNVRFAASLPRLLPQQTVAAARLGLIALESRHGAQEAAARADRDARYSWIPQRSGE